MPAVEVVRVMGEAEVRPLVASSWRRCVNARRGADPDGLPPIRMTADELREYQDGHPLSAATVLLHDLLADSAREADLVYAVVDASGMLMSVRGHRAVLRDAARMNFVPGALWSESAAGTNAPGTALAVGRAVRIAAGEHLNALVRPWSCVAAPIRDPDTRRAVGAVDLTGRDGLAGPYAIGLVRTAARATEEMLARRMAERDGAALASFARLLAPSSAAALVSPTGRVVHAAPELGAARLPGLAVGDTVLLDGRRVEVEPMGTDGYLAVWLVDRHRPAPHGPTVRLSALGLDSAVLEIDGRVRRLSPRHSEILVVLTLAGSGLSAGRLAIDLSTMELHPVTVRAEMSRLRHVVGADVLGSHPYVLLRPVRSDFLAVRELLAAGRAAQALALYNGPLLPTSEAPAVVELRGALEQELRCAVLASGRETLLRRWVGAPWGADDGLAWRMLADVLPGGSARRALAAARARALLGRAASAATPLQPRRS